MCQSGTCRCTAPEATWLCCDNPYSCTSTPPVSGSSCCHKQQCVHAASPISTAVTRCDCAGDYNHWTCTSDTARLAIVTGDAASGVTRLWGSGPDDVWGGRIDGNLAHWDGTSWTKVDVGGVLGEFPLLWGTARNQVWASSGWVGRALLVYDGTSWKPPPVVPPIHIGTDIIALGGRGPADVWVASDSGAVPPRLYHWDGTAWTTLSPGFELRAFWGTATDMWGAGSGYIFRWDGATWVPVYGSGTYYSTYRLWGSGANDVWATLSDSVNGGSSLAHWDGTAWSPVMGLPDRIGFIWGPAANDLWGAGNGLFHYDGLRWTKVAEYSIANSLWGSTGVLWLGGDRAQPLMRYLP